ncbi:MAG: hypothetical protein C0475_08250 [Planctomyces sp.]|nr:hypothetical protein [Planctomyces sp.]
MDRVIGFAWVIDGTEGYGVASTVLALTEHVRRAGHAVRVIAVRQGSLAQELRGRGFDVDVLGAVAMGVYTGGRVARALQLVRNTARGRALARAIRAALIKRTPDVAHVILPTLVSPVSRAIVGLRAPGGPVLGVWEMAAVVGDRAPIPVNRWIYHAAVRRARMLVLANSAYTGRTLVGPRGRARGVEPVTFHLGVDEGRFDPSRVRPVQRRDLGIPSDAVVFGVIARFDGAKGQRQVVGALAAAIGAAPAPDWRLLLIGGPADGPHAQAVRDEAAQRGVADRVIFTGPVPDPERYYAAIDVPCNARTDAEPYGLSVVEAMMMARPVLVHALGGPAETVIDGVTGWHVPAPTPEAWRAGVARAMADRHRWGQMREAARAHALEHFTASAVARRYMDTVQGRLAQSQ